MLEEAGVVFNAPLFGASPSRFAYGRDPFGNVIELLEHKSEWAGRAALRIARAARLNICAPLRHPFLTPP